ncbi:hypothetical protein J7J83_03265 [bacterium]|nr:hypothetical protein [bacterium]
MQKKKTTISTDRKVSIIRLVYLYLISAITFIVFLIGAVALVNLGLKVFVFGITENPYDYNRPMMVCEQYIIKTPPIEGESKTNDDLMNKAYEDCMAKQKQIEDKKNSMWINEQTARELSIGIAQVLVALPLWLFHWSIIERDRKKLKTRGRN